MFILESREFLAAIVGGMLSLLGSSLAIWLQQRYQLKERKHFVAKFIIEQAAYLKSLAEHIENHHQQTGEVWFEYTEQIKIACDAVNRNIEALAFIEEDNSRRAVRAYFSNIYYMSQRANFWQTRFYNQLNISNSDANSAAIEQAKADAPAAKIEASKCVVELKRLSLGFDELKKTLKA